MTGPLVNALAVAVCSLVGCFLVRGIPPRFEESIKKAIGLAIVYVGLRGAFESERVLLLIMSMVAGAVAGELIDIDRGMNALGAWAERTLVRPATGRGAASGRGAAGCGKEAARPFAKGFVSASVVFCSGSMAIVGSIQSGLQGNHELLFAKSILDGAISVVFGASMGIGVLFAAVPVLVYQGAIALAAVAARDLLTPAIITEMSAVGSLLVAAIGFNFLSEKEIRVANLIPAVFIPWIYLASESAVRGFFAH
jgi:uncharacterized membrane protein YqgA involved in biofilm formation